MRRYGLWLSLPIYLPDAGLFTSDSRDLLVHEVKMTPAYWAYWQYGIIGKSYKVVTSKDRAIAICTSDPLTPPEFLWRTREGWQLDLMATLVHVRDVGGSDYAWTMVDVNDAYDRAFRDLYLDYDPLIRLEGGDNTPLPMRGSGE